MRHLIINVHGDDALKKCVFDKLIELGYKDSLGSFRNGLGFSGNSCIYTNYEDKIHTALDRDYNTTLDELFAMRPEPKVRKITAQEIREKFGIEDGQPVSIGDVKI